MAQRTYDQDRTTLPPLTKAIVDANGLPGNRPLDPVPNPNTLSAMLEAIHTLENRVIALET